jgi:glycosyltransferase involved in cell wall biosynthesis
MLRRLLRSGREALYFPDHNAGWIVPATRLGIRATRAERYDAILSTAMPATAHLVGWAIARRTKIPWVADFRDPWSGNAYVHRGPLRRALERCAERAMLRRARRLTAISSSVGSIVESVHGRSASIIANAVDLPQTARSTAPKGFVLCYTGSMYDGKRSPDLLFAALSRLREMGDPAGSAGVVFYGKDSDNVLGAARDFGLQDAVEYRGSVSREVALSEQRAASDLLVFLNMDPATATELGSKVLEYAASRRPILAFGPRGSVVRDWLARNRLGWFASDADEAIGAVRAAYAAYVTGAYDVEPPAGLFATSDLAAAFARVLDEAADEARRASTMAEAASPSP